MAPPPPSSFGPFDDIPEQPQRNLFQAPSNTSFVGESPFRPNGGGSVFSPTPGASSIPKGGLFGGGFSNQNHDAEVEVEEVDDEEDGEEGEEGEVEEAGEEEGEEDAEGEEEEHEEDDGEYEVEKTPARKPSRSFSYASVAETGIPKLRPSNEAPHNYSSPTDGDDEESPNGHDDSRDDGEEDYDEEEEEDEDGDGEYYEDEGEEDYTREKEEADNETMDVDSQPHPPPSHKKPRRSTQNSKVPLPLDIFLKTNPSHLITRSNDLLQSLVQLIAPEPIDDETLPEASPIHRSNAITPGKKVEYITKHVQLFLSNLDPKWHYQRTKTPTHQLVWDADYLASLLLNLHHPQSQSGSKGSPSAIEIYKTFLNKHHPNPRTGDLQHLHAYHPAPGASPKYWDILVHLTLRGELAEVESLLQRGGWENIHAEGGQIAQYKYSDAELSVVDRVCSGAARLIAAAPPLFGKGRNEHEKFGEWRIYRGRVAAAIEELKSLSHTAALREEVQIDEESEPEYRMENVTTTKNGFTSRTMQQVAVRKPSRKLPVRGDDRPITRVPRDIEIGLMNIYQILAGKIDGILDACESWEEAVLGAAIWRRYLDEEDLAQEDEDMDNSIDDTTGNRNYLHRSLRGTAPTLRNLRAKPSSLGYFPDKRKPSRRVASDFETLKVAFRRVTNRDLPINSTSARELGLSYILQGDWKALVDLLIANPNEGYGNDYGLGAYTVAEFILGIAKLAGWSTEDCEDDGVGDVGSLGSLMRGFRDDDLGVLGKGDSEKERAKRARRREERIVEGYVRCLVQVGLLRDEENATMDVDSEKQESTAPEGWDIAIQVLQRWPVITLGEWLSWSRKLASEILSSLELTSPNKVEKILAYCTSYNLPRTLRTISQSYADHLSSLRPPQLGTSLLYLSRAQNRQKIHSILTRLLSQSLLLSTAYPPADQLDSTLKVLLEQGPTGAEEDEILRFELSGYASARSFYESRDRGDMSAAARALVALVRSAGEGVDGGRGIDEEWDSAVEWWVAGVLIGEALAFLGKNKRYFSIREIFDILKVIQDLTSSIDATYPSRHHHHQKSQNKAEVFLKKTILAYQNPGEVPRLLKKSVTSLTKESRTLSSSSTSSGMLSSWQHVDTPSSSSSSTSHLDDENGHEAHPDEGFALVLPPAEIENISRGWDWREGLVPVLEKVEKTENHRGKGGQVSVLETVIRIARMAFAKELARGWLDGEGDLGVGEVLGAGGVAGKELVKGPLVGPVVRGREVEDVEVEEEREGMEMELVV